MSRHLVLLALVGFAAAAVSQPNAMAGHADTKNSASIELVGENAGAAADRRYVDQLKSLANPINKVANAFSADDLDDMLPAMTRRLGVAKSAPGMAEKPSMEFKESVSSWWRRRRRGSRRRYDRRRRRRYDRRRRRRYDRRRRFSDARRRWLRRRFSDARRRFSDSRRRWVNVAAIERGAKEVSNKAKAHTERVGKAAERTSKAAERGTKEVGAKAENTAKAAERGTKEVAAKAAAAAQEAAAKTERTAKLAETATKEAAQKVEKKGKEVEEAATKAAQVVEKGVKEAAAKVEAGVKEAAAKVDAGIKEAAAKVAAAATEAAAKVEAEMNKLGDLGKCLGQKAMSAAKEAAGDCLLNAGKDMGKCVETGKCILNIKGCIKFDQTFTYPAERRRLAEAGTYAAGCPIMFSECGKVTGCVWSGSRCEGTPITTTTAAPTKMPTPNPTPKPSSMPTRAPTGKPTPKPTKPRITGAALKGLFFASASAGVKTGIDIVANLNTGVTTIGLPTEITLSATVGVGADAAFDYSDDQTIVLSKGGKPITIVKETIVWAGPIPFVISAELKPYLHITRSAFAEGAFSASLTAAKTINFNPTVTLDFAKGTAGVSGLDSTDAFTLDSSMITGQVSVEAAAGLSASARVAAEITVTVNKLATIGFTPSIVGTGTTHGGLNAQKGKGSMGACATAAIDGRAAVEYKFNLPTLAVKTPAELAKESCLMGVEAGCGNGVGGAISECMKGSHGADPCAEARKACDDLEKEVAKNTPKEVTGAISAANGLHAAVDTWAVVQIGGNKLEYSKQFSYDACAAVALVEEALPMPPMRLLQSPAPHTAQSPGTLNDAGAIGRFDSSRPGEPQSPCVKPVVHAGVTLAAPCSAGCHACSVVCAAGRDTTPCIQCVEQHKCELCLACLDQDKPDKDGVDKVKMEADHATIIAAGVKRGDISPAEASIAMGKSTTKADHAAGVAQDKAAGIAEGVNTHTTAADHAKGLAADKAAGIVGTANINKDAAADAAPVVNAGVTDNIDKDTGAKVVVSASLLEESAVAAAPGAAAPMAMEYSVAGAAFVALVVLSAVATRTRRTRGDFMPLA